MKYQVIMVVSFQVVMAHANNSVWPVTFLSIEPNGVRLIKNIVGLQGFGRVTDTKKLYSSSDFKIHRAYLPSCAGCSKLFGKIK